MMPSLNRVSCWSISSMVIVCFALCSCFGGGPKPVKVHRVSGIVTVKDSPAPNIIVHFVPNPGRPSIGVTNAQGQFDMQYQSDRAGVLPGEHKVWVEYKPSSPAEEMKIRAGNSPLSAEMQEALKKYGTLETTPYRVTVDKDQKDLAIKLD
ncbi:MAG: hypothetical protein JWP89_2059 [Schlesneria sp.]|nr:hypothetical protein [Schlesneria sp.]